MSKTSLHPYRPLPPAPLLRSDIHLDMYGGTQRLYASCAGIRDAGEIYGLGFESARQQLGISVPYWESLDTINARKVNATHRQVQAHARDWYDTFRVRVARVEKEYGF